MRTIFKLKKIREHKAVTVGAILVGLPAFILLYQIINQSINIPYQDQWELVPVIQSIDKGSFTPSMIYELHNQHRLVFPKAIMLISAYLSSWNIRIEMIIGWVFALLSFMALIKLFNRSTIFKKYKWEYFILALTSSVMIFSLNQAENWLWGWQLQWFLCNLATLCAIYFLTSNKLDLKTYALAILSAVIATYSLGSGQLIWPIGALILIIMNRRIRYWLVASVVVLSSYYYSYHPVGYQTPNSFLLNHPLSVIKYFFGYLGRPITENANYAVILGMVGLVLFIFLIGLHISQNGYSNTKKSLAIVIAPFSLMLFALLNAAITSLSRSGLGFLQALSSRYITVSTLFWIGLIWLVIILVIEHKNKIQEYRLVLNTVTCLFLSIVVVASVSSAYIFTAQTQIRKQIQLCTMAPSPSNECIRLTYPSPDRARPFIEYLKSKHWGGYY